MSLAELKIALYARLLQIGPDKMSDNDVELLFYLSKDNAIQNRLDNRKPKLPLEWDLNND